VANLCFTVGKYFAVSQNLYGLWKEAVNLAMNNYKKTHQNVLDDKAVQMPTAPAEDSAADLPLKLDRSQRGSLVSQIVGQISALVESGRLSPLQRMPSVRALAARLAISAFSAVEAYDRLVALGLLVSRRGAGYFVAPRHGAGSAPEAAPPPAEKTPPLSTAALLASELFYGAPLQDLLPAAQPYLPEDWTCAKWLQECTRTALRCRSALTPGFAGSAGLLPLRQQLAASMQQAGLGVTADNLLLTRSAVHALDLTLRALLVPNDAVLIEDPCFPSLRPLLAQHGFRVFSVQRSAQGLDLAQFAQLAERHRPKLAIVTPCLHNPLGTTLSSAQAHQLLALAEQFDLQIVEDDVFRPLAEPSAPSLALMDGLKRVIRIDSSSKILPSLVRVGSVMAAPETLEKIARVKLATGLCPEFAEKTLLHLMLSSEYRRHLSRLKTRFEIAREQLLQRLYELGLKPLAVPDGGPFLCVQVPSAESGLALAQFALERGVAVSPSLRFAAADAPDAPWFRLNVAYAGQPALCALLEALAQHRTLA